MRSESPIVRRYTLSEKVEFLKRPGAYLATSVDVVETHMSWVFLVDQFAYKLKKPVCYDFLDFRSLDARYEYCKEEVRLNRPLAGDTYVDVVALKVDFGVMNLDGTGQVIDWLVKMKRLPAEYMLDNMLKEGKVRTESIEQAAKKLAEFYVNSPPVEMDWPQFRERTIRNIEQITRELLRPEFKLRRERIAAIRSNLLDFLLNHADLFARRISYQKIIDGHGDLRPEHICIGSNPVIIDRIEFNRDLRILDIAEELSFLAMECEMYGFPKTGQLFLNIYSERSGDEIPDSIVSFYKAARAFLRAKLSIHHLLEKSYQMNERKWSSRCENYLQASNNYCTQLKGKLAL